MSRRTAEASKAIRKAWENEQQLVAQGKGTRDWTEEQQKDILDENKGKAYEENGKAFEGHHMQSAEAHPEYQGDPGNIQFLTRQEHKEAHGGDFRNPTNGYYDPITHETMDFGDGKFIPCKQIELSHPVVEIEKTDNSTKDVADEKSEEESHERETEQATPAQTNKPNDKPIKPQPTPKKSGGGIGGFFKSVADGARKFATDHPIITAVGVALVGAAIDAAVSSSRNKSNSASDDRSTYDYQPPTYQPPADSTNELQQIDTEEYSSVPPERNYPDHHASPEEHMVSGYDRVRYGRKEHIDPYKRGGKK